MYLVTGISITVRPTQQTTITEAQTTSELLHLFQAETSTHETVCFSHPVSSHIEKTISPLNIAKF